SNAVLGPTPRGAGQTIASERVRGRVEAQAPSGAGKAEHRDDPGRHRRGAHHHRPGPPWITVPMMDKLPERTNLAVRRHRHLTPVQFAVGEVSRSPAG